MAEQYNAGEVVGRVRFDVPQSELDKISQLQQEISGVAQAMQGVSGGMQGGMGRSGASGMVGQLAQSYEQAQKLHAELQKIKESQEGAADEIGGNWREWRGVLTDFPKAMRAVGVTAGMASALTAGVIAIAQYAKPQNEVAQTMEGALREITEAEKSIVFAINKDLFQKDVTGRIGDAQELMAYAQGTGVQADNARIIAGIQYDIMKMSMAGDWVSHKMLEALVGSNRSLETIAVGIGTLTGAAVGGRLVPGVGSVIGAPIGGAMAASRVQHYLNPGGSDSGHTSGNFSDLATRTGGNSIASPSWRGSG